MCIFQLPMKNSNDGIKNMTIGKKTGSNSGVILVVVLWILIILSAMAMGLGRRTGVDLSLAKYSLGKLKADYAARAAVIYSIYELKKDSEDTGAKKFDTIYQ